MQISDPILVSYTPINIYKTTHKYSSSSFFILSIIDCMIVVMRRQRHNENEFCGNYRNVGLLINWSAGRVPQKAVIIIVRWLKSNKGNGVLERKTIDSVN